MRVNIGTLGLCIVISIMLTSMVHNIRSEATEQPVEVIEVEYILLYALQEQKPTEDKQEPQSNKKSLGVFTVTAYCPCESCTGPYNDGYTFTGDKATEGVTVATYPEQIPLGTEIYIEGIGNRIAQDIAREL